jgi:CheY-like chemotaxis protein
MNNGALLVLIEDNPDDSELIVRALRKAKILNPVTVIEDGEKALDYLNERGAYQDRASFPLPGLFLLDLKLPRVSGFEVLQAIRANPLTRRTLVIILTSSNQESDIRTAYDLGANSYLTKPMSGDSLVEMMLALDAYWIKLNKAAS